VAIDDVAARAFLVEQLRAVPESIESLRPGEWSRVYAIRRADDELVVRFSRYGDDFEKDRAVAAWSSTDLPVPEVLDIGAALGLAYAVTRRVRGEFLETLDDTAVRAVLPRLFATLDAARTIDLSSTAGFGGWTALDGGQHRTWREALLAVSEAIPTEREAGWRERLEASPTGAGPFDEAHARMRALAAMCPEEQHLIHDDLLNRNVMVDGGRIAAVLDWGSSKYGDFLYDVASLVFWAPWFPAWSNIDFLAEAARHYTEIGLAVPNYEARVRCYAVRIGLGGMSYNAWKGPERWQHLARIAARTLEFARGDL
jgi:hygromycin-B 4-O-kinase